MSFTGSISLVLCHQYDDMSKVSFFAHEVKVHALVWVRLMLMFASWLGVGHARFVFLSWLLRVRRPKPSIRGRRGASASVARVAGSRAHLPEV